MLSTNRVDTLLSYQDRPFGQLAKVQPDITPPKTAKPAISDPQPGVIVNLSSNALAIATILRQPMPGSSTVAADFDSFLQDLNSELKSQGAKAASLSELPESYDSARITLAKQAANHLLSTYYNTDPLYLGTSSENPLAGLDRLSLSRMAFNDSGAFTPAERLLATLEMSSRDLDYRNRTYDLAQSLGTREKATVTGMIIANSSDAQLASAMTEEEKNWRGWTSVEYFAAYTDDLIRKFSIDPPELPNYQNMKADQGAELAVYTDKNGAISWVNIPLKTQEDMRLALLAVLPDAAQTNQKESNASNRQQNAWITLYLTVDNY